MYPRMPLAWEKVKIGHGFTTRSVDRAHLEKHNLLRRGPLAFVNELCVLVDEKQDELPEEEWDSLEFTLRSLMLNYEDGELYGHLLHTYGAKAIEYNAWVRFTNDPVWDICLQAFTDMPTEILEEYGSRWVGYSSGEDKDSVMEAISKRTDIYGGNNLPQDLLQEILFNSKT